MLQRLRHAPTVETCSPGTSSFLRKLVPEKSVPPRSLSFLKRFFKDKESKQHFPAEGEATLSGVIIEGDNETGLARRITRVIEGGSLIK